MALFVPTRFCRRVEEITREGLQQMGIRGVLLDVDNTLSPHGDPTPLPAALQWVNELQAAGIKVLIVSNNKEERVAPFAAKFGLGFIANAAKPLPLGFRRGQALLGLPKEALLVVGDQLFTDILGANLAGMPSVLVEPIEMENKPLFRIKRRLERPLLRRGRRKRGNQ